eukprot:15330147-Alexandrium_andersonii.AAC.1
MPRGAGRAPVPSRSAARARHLARFHSSSCPPLSERSSPALSPEPGEALGRRPPPSRGRPPRGQARSVAGSSARGL